MPMFIGERLTDLRIEYGFSQKELAAMLNVHPNTVSKYESEITIPSISVQLKIAKIFNISLDYLNGLTDKEVSYDRTNYIEIPAGYPTKMKSEVIKYLHYLMNEDYKEYGEKLKKKNRQ